uniref:hypothetical protein n=1 Tax=Novacetimonas labruscae TaxID=3229898 RepID=UPI003B5AEA30
MMKPQRSTNDACSHHASNGFGAMERLPKPVLCIPLVLQWLWLGLRYRSLTLPSVVNPAIETGGLAGESKSRLPSPDQPGARVMGRPHRPRLSR